MTVGWAEHFYKEIATASSLPYIREIIWISKQLGFRLTHVLSWILVYLWQGLSLTLLNSEIQIVADLIK